MSRERHSSGRRTLIFTGIGYDTCDMEKEFERHQANYINKFPEKVENIGIRKKILIVGLYRNREQNLFVKVMIID